MIKETRIYHMLQYLGYRSIIGEGWYTFIHVVLKG